MVSIALYNLKGGVGKTATCVNFAHLAAQDGYKTMLWDLDAQGASSFYFDADHSISNFKKLLGHSLSLADMAIATPYENLLITPSDTSLRKLDILLSEQKASKKQINHLLKQVNKDYDFIFIDCPAGFSTLADNIFYAADIVLMPVIPTTLSYRTYEIVADYFEEKEIDPEKLMCIFSMADLRKKMHREMMEELMKDRRFFQNYIPYLSDIEKMGVYQRPVTDFASSGRAAQSYRNLWEEIKEGVLE